MKQFHPNWSTRQVMKQLSRSWSFMTAAQKARYNLMSKRDRQRFEAQRQRHKNCITSGQPCNCKLNEAAEQSAIRSMVGAGAPILALCLPDYAATVQAGLVDGQNMIYVAPTPSKSGRPRGRPPGNGPR